jgi:3-phenylpropionate/trans-cinnamate dioxygenase ferredoxin subunit
LSKPTTEYIRVCSVGDVPEEGAFATVVRGMPIAVIRSRGRLYAIEDVCSHEEVPLSEGEIEDGMVECWLHGSRFDLETGRAIGPPATAPVPVFPVKVTDGEVYVAIIQPHSQ